MAAHQGIAVRDYLERNDIKITDFSSKIGLSRQSVYNLFGREKIEKDLRQRIVKPYPDINLDNVITPVKIDNALLSRLQENEREIAEIKVELNLLKKLIARL